MKGKSMPVLCHGCEERVEPIWDLERRTWYCPGCNVIQNLSSVRGYPTALDIDADDWDEAHPQGS